MWPSAASRSRSSSPAGSSRSWAGPWSHRPWPTGPTDAANLISLCRRHHRVKQRFGWTVRLAVDGTCTWTDPTGRVRTTSAIDALRTVVLPALGGPSGMTARPHATTTSGPPAQLGDTGGHPARDPESGSRTMYDLLGRIGELHSGLEFTLEHLAAAVTSADLTRAAALSSASLHSTGHRARLTVDVHRPHAHRPRADRLVMARWWAEPPGHRASRRRRSHEPRRDDEPPF